MSLNRRDFVKMASFAPLFCAPALPAEVSPVSPVPLSSHAKEAAPRQYDERCHVEMSNGMLIFADAPDGPGLLFEGLFLDSARCPHSQQVTELHVQRLIGPAALLEAFYAPLSDVARAAHNHVSFITKLNNDDVVCCLTSKHTVLCSCGLSVRADTLCVAEQLCFVAAPLRVLQGDLSLRTQATALTIGTASVQHWYEECHFLASLDTFSNRYPLYHLGHCLRG